MKYEIIFDELEQGETEGPLNLSYDFEFDEPEDEYENDGADLDLAKILE